jgi:hypothetical protein
MKYITSQGGKGKCHEDVEGSESRAPPFLASALEGGVVSCTIRHPLTPGKEGPTPTA